MKNLVYILGIGLIAIIIIHLFAEGTTKTKNILYHSSAHNGGNIMQSHMGSNHELHMPHMPAWHHGGHSGHPGSKYHQFMDGARDYGRRIPRFVDRFPKQRIHTPLVTSSAASIVRSNHVPNPSSHLPSQARLPIKSHRQHVAIR
jgi:hypothetical protein